MKTWLSGRRGRRALLVVLAVLVLAAVLFYPVENWRGRRAWEEAKQDYAARGEKLSRKDFVPPEIPDEQNRMAHPFMRRHFGVDGVPLGLSHPTILKPSITGYPGELTALQKLSRTNVNEVPVTELAKDLHPDEVIELIQFEETPLTDVLKTLFRQIDAKVEFDGEQEPPFVDVRGQDTAVSIRREHIAVVAVIQKMLDYYELSVSRVASNQTFRVAAKLPSLESILGKLSTMDPVLAEFDEAMKRPQAILIDVSQIDEMGSHRNYVNSRTLTQNLVTRAQVRFLIGDGKGAYEDLHRMRQTVEITGSFRPRLVTDVMLQTAFARNYARLIEELLRAGLLVGDGLEQVEADLATIDLPDALPEALRVERAIQIEWFEGHASEPEAMVNRLQSWNASVGITPTFAPTNTQSVLPAASSYARRRASEVMQRAYAWGGPRGWVNQNEVTLARWWQWQLEGIDSNGHRIDVLLRNEVHQRMEKGLDGPVTPYNYLAQMVTFDQLKMVQSLAGAQVCVDEAYVACALERFRKNEGHYPEALAQLVPRFASRIPVDVCDGKPLRYHREQDGYRLYSIGWNGVDEQGKCSFYSDGSPYWGMEKEDWVWGGVPKR